MGIRELICPFKRIAVVEVLGRPLGKSSMDSTSRHCVGTHPALFDYMRIYEENGVWAGRHEDSAVKLFIIALFLVSLTSCSDGQQQRERKIRDVLSWSATAEMVLDARTKMLVSNSFAILTIERCTKEIGSLSKELPTFPENLAALAGRLNMITGSAHRELINGRTDGLSQHLRDLRSLESELRAKSGAAD
ncbi:hypothetical protein [Rhizobium sp. CNPSo 4039]|uniref:hypothetical protein n=1 Tax=Rhizobium sp. CNPSo 4039 TaxID=3021409 RepID=UPI00254F2A26|nr:hypothetical protein [Rhizobium sp. CNPSo 4039]MDK4715316.1 hypothetical protein [Rhizobium sp. CNPSo 4039]